MKVYTLWHWINRSLWLKCSCVLNKMSSQYWHPNNIVFAHLQLFKDMLPDEIKLKCIKKCVKEKNTKKNTSMCVYITLKASKGIEDILSKWSNIYLCIIYKMPLYQNVCDNLTCLCWQHLRASTNSMPFTLYFCFLTLYFKWTVLIELCLMHICFTVSCAISANTSTLASHLDLITATLLCDIK